MTSTTPPDRTPDQPNIPRGSNGKPRYSHAERYTVTPRLTLRTRDRETTRDDFLGNRGTGIGIRRTGSLSRWRSFLRSRITNPRGSGAKRIKHNVQ